MPNKTIKLTESDLKNMVTNVINRVFGLTDLNDGIHELTTTDEFKKYGQKIWAILQNSYKNLGGFKTYISKEDMINRISLAILCVQNKRIVACAIYRDDLGGQKLNGCGTIDGSQKNKELLRLIIKDDIENFKKYHWVEVSYPLEKWFKEEGGNPIPSKLASSLLHKSKSKIEELEDGVHYRRQIGVDGIVVTKAIYGFNSEETYQKVMENLEKYTGFQDYNSFKNHINGLPKLDESFEYYQENHKNKQIAVAIEVIIQIGNIWDDGIFELTPKMQNYLRNSINVLERYPNKTNQILSLIKKGKYYLNNMEVLRCNTNKDFNYILYPLL